MFGDDGLDVSWVDSVVVEEGLAEGEEGAGLGLEGLAQGGVGGGDVGGAGGVGGEVIEEGLFCGQTVFEKVVGVVPADVVAGAADGEAGFLLALTEVGAPGGVLGLKLQ